VGRRREKEDSLTLRNVAYNVEVRKWNTSVFEADTDIAMRIIGRLERVWEREREIDVEQIYKMYDLRLISTSYAATARDFAVCVAVV